MRLSWYCFFLASWQIDRRSSDASNQWIWSFPVQSRVSLVSRPLDAVDPVGQIGPEIAMFAAPKARMGLFPIAYNDPRYG
jgi:hypothetical protein